MKARLAKLLAVTVPALAALAIAPGSASAWSIQPYCSYGTGTLTAVSTSSLYPKSDANKGRLGLCPDQEQHRLLDQGRHVHLRLVGRDGGTRANRGPPSPALRAGSAP